jgi:hypothetical protein
MNFLSIFKSNEKITSITKESTTSTYKPSYETFYNWTKHHRNHQQRAVEECYRNTVGQVSLPTGVGKSRVQIHLHVQKMIDNTANNIFGVQVIASHRLALNHQLLNDLLNVSINAGLPFDILFVGSDRFDDSSVHFKFRKKGFTKLISNTTSTTKQEDILKAYNQAILNKRHLLVVSTYQSFNRLKCLPSIELCTYDEAHTLVGESFLNNIVEVQDIIKNRFFFTATRRVIGDEGGMNCKEIFGEVICEKSPREMIDKSEIVPPKLHIIDTIEEGDFNNHKMIVKTVIVGFQQHKTLVEENSAEPNSLGAKLLITTTGNLEMQELINDQLFQEHCKANNIHVFAFSAEYGSFYNFEKLDRQIIIKKMDELKDTDDAILMHIDILTEGIDLPSITGVMPFRELNKVKMLQTIGRSARLLLKDRIDLYNGVLQPKDYDNYIKPYCWIVIPRFFKSLGDFDTMKNIIKTIINTYEVPVEEYSVINNYKAINNDDLDRITEIDKSTRKDKESDLIYLIEDILKEKLSKLDSAKATIETISSFFTRK